MKKLFKHIWCKFFRCKKSKPIVEVFNEDIEINESLVHDIVEINDCTVYVKGQYSVNSEGSPIEEIRIKKLIINEGGYLKVHSIDTVIDIDEIEMYRGQFTVATEAGDFNNGTSIPLHSLRWQQPPGAAQGARAQLHERAHQLRDRAGRNRGGRHHHPGGGRPLLLLYRTHGRGRGLRRRRAFVGCTGFAPAVVGQNGPLDGRNRLDRPPATRLFAEKLKMRSKMGLKRRTWLRS